MTQGWTAKDVERVRLRQAAQPRAKYGSVKTVVDGVEFDSKREAHRYRELKLMQHARQIRNLRWQPRYTLFALSVDCADLHDANAGIVSARRQPVCEYVADFEYALPSGALVVEDVKSPATRKKEVYRLKRKLFEAQYGMEIHEV